MSSNLFGTGIISLILKLLFLTCFANGGLSPVVLVPGDGGSQIAGKWDKEDSPNYFCVKHQKEYCDLWLNLEELVPFIIYCWADNMRLVYNNGTRTTSNRPGVDTMIPGFGNTETVEWLDPSHRSFSKYFVDVVEEIMPLGYKRNGSVRGAPYDFRKAPNELHLYFDDLRHLIETTFEENGHRVTLIAHSMGSPVLHYFLIHQSQSWKDKYIQSLISLAGAWGGAIKAMKVYVAGDDLGNWFIKNLAIRVGQRTEPSLAFLLPSSEIWGSDYVMVQTPWKNFTTSNMQEFFDALNLRDAYDMYLDTKDLLYNAPAPGVEIHCLHGVDVPTVVRLIYKDNTSFPLYPTVIYGNGDKTVNYESASYCLKWVSEQKQRIFHKVFPKVDHMQILSNKDVLEYISNYLKNVYFANTNMEQSKSSHMGHNNILYSKAPAWNVKNELHKRLRKHSTNWGEYEKNITNFEDLNAFSYVDSSKKMKKYKHKEISQIQRF